MINCIIVGLGGFAGAVLRYLVGLVSLGAQNGFPFKTLLVNIAGSFAIGLVVAAGIKKEWNPKLVLFLKTGICGGFTTFSSFALETTQLAQRGTPLLAALYIALSLIGGLAAVYAGLCVGRVVKA